MNGANVCRTREVQQGQGQGAGCGSGGEAPRALAPRTSLPWAGPTCEQQGWGDSAPLPCSGSVCRAAPKIRTTWSCRGRLWSQLGELGVLSLRRGRLRAPSSVPCAGSLQGIALVPVTHLMLWENMQNCAFSNIILYGLF